MLKRQTRKYPGKTDRYPTLYPWDTWFSAGKWVAIRGRDFDCEPISFLGGLRKRAKDRGVQVNVHMRGNEITVRVVQPVEKNGKVVEEKGRRK